jgi:hypothetical protein
MSDYTGPLSDEEQTMIDDCEQRSEKLSSWELQFIDSVSRQTYALTAKQRRVLDDIWDRIT